MTSNNSKKYQVVTLGCRANQYESQAFQDQLNAMGYTRAQDGEQAELCIVNTCTVTEAADRDGRYAIRQLARKNPGTRLVVTGCLAERQPDEIRAIEGVTDVIPNAQKEMLLPTIFPDEEIPEFAINQFNDHTRAFVKVQDGCNSFCTFCVIPYVRGRSRSRTISDVVREVEGLIANGFKEVVLTGINIGDYDGGDPEDTSRKPLADLVRAVDKIPGISRVRISSIHPHEVNDDLIDAILNGKHTCPSLHLVLQSGSNVVLKRMNRKYTRQVFMKTVEQLAIASPDFTFTTDLIVGFPGETEADFEESLQVIREVNFAKVHMFPYSNRPRTKAATMPDQVPYEIIQERKQKVLRLAEQTAFALRQKYVGRLMKVLTESDDKIESDLISGHTDNFLKVIFPKNQYVANEIVEVELIENRPEGLVGKLK